MTRSPGESLKQFIAQGFSRPAEYAILTARKVRVAPCDTECTFRERRSLSHRFAARHTTYPPAKDLEGPTPSAPELSEQCETSTSCPRKVSGAFLC